MKQIMGLVAIIGTPLLMVMTPWFQGGQATVIRHGANLPAVCAANQDFFFKDGVGPYWCSALNTWSFIGTPAGFLGMIDSGTCPDGYTEDATIDGRMALATIASHGNVGSTGGADTITPMGTVGVPVFIGISSSTSSDSAGTPSGSNSAPAFTGGGDSTAFDLGSGTTVMAGTGVVVAAHTHIHTFTPDGLVSAPTFTGVILPTHSHTFTPYGTVSAPSFTGTPFDNRSAFMRVIYCRKA